MSFADKFLRLTFGFALFMPINLAILAGAEKFRSPTTGVLFALLTALLAYLFHRRGMPWQGAGLGLGFAIMTLVTGGTCTLFATSSDYAEVGGLWYLALMIGALVLAGIVKAFSPPSTDPTGKQP